MRLINKLTAYGSESKDDFLHLHKRIHRKVAILTTWGWGIRAASLSAIGVGSAARLKPAHRMVLYWLIHINHYLDYSCIQSNLILTHPKQANPQPHDKLLTCYELSFDGKTSN